MRLRRLFLCSIVAAAVSTAVARDIHVSPTGSDRNDGTREAPLKTLRAAQQAVRAAKKDGMPADGINVVLHGGTYSVTEPLMLGPEDSGEAGIPVVWRAAEGAKPVISGGKPVPGWTEYKDGIWKAPLKQETKLRQLYVNDRPGDMAFYGKMIIPLGWRKPFKVTGKEDWAAEPGTAFEGMAFAAEDVPPISNPEDLEFQQRRTWTIQRTSCTGISEPTPGEKVIHLARPVAATGMRMGWNCGFSTEKWKEVYLYNSLSFLDEPGEFYFDRKASTLYYMPRPGQDMKTATVLVPQTDQLVTISGKDLKTHAHDISLEGLTFSHTGWQMMKMGSSYGAITYQSSAMSVKFLKDGMWHGNPAAPIYTSTDVPPGVVDLNSAERIAIRDCRFRSLGLTAVDIENDVQDVEVVGNLFNWVEGSGVNIGHPHHTYIGKENDDNNGFGPYHIDNSKDKWDETVEGLVKNVTVANNLMRNTCWTWWQMSPIALYYGHGIYIEHNDILDCPYIGITIGWSWGEFNGIARKGKWHPTLGKKGGKPSLSVHDVKVNYNRVVHPYLLLNDTGGLYFLGDCAMQQKKKGKVPPYSQVIGNYVVEDKPRDQASTIYTDEGSAYLRFANNVMDGEMGVWRIFQRGRDNRHKRFENNFWHRYGKGRTRNEGQYGITDAKTVNIGPKISNRPRNAPPRKLEEWPEAAQEIIKNAGLEPKYANLFDELEN